MGGIMKFILYRNNSKSQSSYLKAKCVLLFTSVDATRESSFTNEAKGCENDFQPKNSESNCAFVFRNISTLSHSHWFMIQRYLPIAFSSMSLYETHHQRKACSVP